MAAAALKTTGFASVGRAVVPTEARDFIALMKPRVMSLVVFTGATGLVCAGGRADLLTRIVAILCIAVGAGAAGALNMAFEADIDAKMRRTRGRPVAAGRVSAGDAAALGGVLGLFSVMTMGLAVNLTAAVLLAFIILYYAVFYTLWLKRLSPQNIVIGGAAGALPPVVGWAAATGDLPLNAWLLFAIIFLWTPPHFWALALNSGEDYERAGVPMMTVAKGPRATRLQILLYSLVLAPLGVVPAFTGLGGPVYAAASTLGGALFVLLAVRLFISSAGEDRLEGPEGLYAVRPGAKAARDLFAYSILYLFALFSALLLEHGPKGLG